MRYWARLTGAAVEYAPYQERAEALGLDPVACRQAVQLLTHDGRHSSAAAASLQVLAYAGRPLWAWLYTCSRLFARLAEQAYALTAAHRESAYVIARLLWGRERLPACYTRAAQLFPRLLGLILFLSGCVKLLSGDPSWASLSALDFHYYTQPLPTPLAWYAHQLPAWFDRVSVLATLAIELVLPFMIFAPRRPRLCAAGGILLLELCIVLTGNYNYFNFLTIALCVFLFEDADPPIAAHGAVTAPRRWRQLASAPILALLVLHNVYYLWRPFATPPAVLHALLAPLAPLRLVNGYGLFAVMTRARPEIEIEGSLDGHTWRPYVFRYKPGAPARALRWNIPHQPRLDWQMWFAALGGADHTPWFRPLLARLLANEPAVTGLLEVNPFAARAPRLLRAVLYDYRFSTPAERRASGAVWIRTRSGLYFPPVSLE